MTTKKSPLQQVKEKFGSKQALVDALLGLPSKLIDHATDGQDKDAFRKKLFAVANAKLLRMHALYKDVQNEFGSKEKMVDKILTLKNRLKDKDYRSSLLQKTSARLYDMAKALQKSIQSSKK